MTFGKAGGNENIGGSARVLHGCCRIWDAGGGQNPVETRQIPTRAAPAILAEPIFVMRDAGFQLQLQDFREAISVGRQWGARVIFYRFYLSAGIRNHWSLGLICCATCTICPTGSVPGASGRGPKMDPTKSGAGPIFLSSLRSA
jgi:hypothetical protein